MVKVCQEHFKAENSNRKSDGFYMDGYLKSNLDRLTKAVKDDWDCVLLIDGVEGAGKSILAQQIGYYLDPTLNLDRIIFSPEEFLEATKHASKYSCVIFDEAFSGLSSRSAISSTNKAIVRMLMEVRQRNLYLILVLPTFFELDKYASIFRSRCLIHVTADNFKRGFFKFYSYGKKKLMYVKGKKEFNYKVAFPDFIGRFAGLPTLDPVAYKKKKSDSFDRISMKDEINLTPEARKDLFAPIIQSVYKDRKIPKITQKIISEWFNLDVKTVYNYLKESNSLGKDEKSANAKAPLLNLTEGAKKK